MDYYSYIKGRLVLKHPSSSPLKSKLAVGNSVSAITVPIFIAQLGSMSLVNPIPSLKRKCSLPPIEEFKQHLLGTPFMLVP